MCGIRYGLLISIRLGSIGHENVEDFGFNTVQHFNFYMLFFGRGRSRIFNFLKSLVVG